MSKWFKNKETGVVWEVADEALIKRLASNQNAYQEVANPTTKKSKPTGEGNTGASDGDKTEGNK